MSVEIRGAQVVRELRGRQVRLLLAYLVLHRAREVGREELSVAMWPDTAPQSQDGALRTLLSRVRSAVGTDVLTGREGLSLALPEPVWIDVEAARTHLQRAQAALEQAELRGAWALAQVPLNVAGRGLLPGLQASWLDHHREELEAVRLAALEVVGRAALALGGSQLASAERAARALVATEPYRESAYSLLMEALAGQGNVAEAVRVFESLRTLLRRELGTVPSPAALAVHERLLLPHRRAGGAGSLQSAAGHTVALPSELATRAGGRLVGRQEEMERLERFWQGTRSHAATKGEAAPDSAGVRVVVLSGDPGIGKTRLVAELARRGHAQGAIVLAGRAPEESLVSYQPFLEALRHFVTSASLDELRATVREYGPEIARLVPELRRRLPELGAAEPADPDAERYRLFEAVVGLLSAMSRRAPILLVLEDLHWADRPTMLLLRHLARAEDPHRLLIVAAYRTIEAPPEGFAGMLADLRRERLLTELRIGGLSEAETAELVRVHAGRPPTRAFAAALHKETEGNPLFIEEIVRHLLDAGVDPGSANGDALQRFGLPEGIKHIIAQRLRRFDTQATEWLRVAAVIGRDFDARLLERVLGVPETMFLDVLEQVLESGLVVEAGERQQRYSFSHALIREALYEGMSAPRRARIHRRIGEAIEAEGRDSDLGALALHFTRAATEEGAAKALDYARAAGDRAASMLAHEQAAEHYGRALEVLERFSPGDVGRRAELLLGLGEAQVRTGEPALAWETLSLAAAMAEEVGNTAGVARAAIAASRRYIQQPGVVDEALIGLLERALGLTRGERSTTRVLLLARLCGALYFSEARGRMRELSDEATALARELGDPEAGVHAYAARRRALWDPIHLSERLAASTEMLVLARQLGNVEQELLAHAWLVVDLLERGEPKAVEAQIEAFSTGAARLGQPLFQWQAIVWRAMRALLAGRLEAAEALAAEALATGAPAETVAAHQYHAIQLLAVRREQGRFAELEEAVRAFVAANPQRPAWRAALANLLRDAGRPGAAAALLDELAVDGFSLVPYDGDWLTAMALLADVACGLGEVDRAVLLYDLLAPHESQNVVIGLGAVCLGAVSRCLGRLAVASGRPERAAAHFEHALGANARLGAVVELAHTRVDYAELLGPGAQARTLLEAAEATASELGLARVATRVEGLRAGGRRAG